MARPRPALSPREIEIARIGRSLERSSYPRLQMSLLVALTGAAGFFASYCLLRVGMVMMASRYLVSLTFAYGVFLLLLWLWLRWRASDFAEGAPGPEQVADADLSLPAMRSGRPGKDSGSGLLDDIGKLEFKALPVLLVVAIVAGVGCLLFTVVASAPVLFAELLVDGMLSASLYGRMRNIDQQHWLQSALKRTLTPFAALAALTIVFSLIVAALAPGAITIGQAISMSF